MALYNPKDAHSLELAYKQFERLVEKGELFELRAAEQQRTLGQNSLLHLFLQYAASVMGEKMDYVKLYYYKMAANPELYTRERWDPITEQTVMIVRSSRDLTTEEMTESIKRFDHWCQTVPAEPFRMPIPEDDDEMREARMYIENNKLYI